LLKDGFPLYGGFSGGLSIMQIPPLDLAQFEIIKGSSSTLYGGGAIAGLVNMVSKITVKEMTILGLHFTVQLIIIHPMIQMVISLLISQKQHLSLLIQSSFTILIPIPLYGSVSMQL